MTGSDQDQKQDQDQENEMSNQNIIEEPEPFNLVLREESLHNNNNNAPPIYCAKCFHSFCIPESCDESNASECSNQDSCVDSDDDSLSPIFREDPEDVEEIILDEIAEYMKSNPLVIWRASFEKELVKDVATLLFEEWREDNLCEEYDLPEIQDWVKHMANYYFKTESEMPPRQGGRALEPTPLRTAVIRNKLRIINALPKQTQKTQEWYDTRYGLLTASNVWKAIGTEAQQNQLIVEKCVSFDKFKEDCARQSNLSPDNPMSWGQKYEPISALIYEKKNGTRLGEYGCIVHPQWRFLGASPDGINLDPDSLVYGRMVEIKNIVNRNIDGVPLDAYWVQMQIQMEVCNLDECDFVETRIKEYEHKYDFFESDNPWKGVVLTFVPRIRIESSFQNQTSSSSQKPFYEYLLLDPHDLSPGQTVENWTQSKKDQYPNFVLSNGSYWGLDQYSCVLVKRNRAWFQAAIPKIERIWQIIEKERVTGCEHRAPKKREPKNTTMTGALGGCVVPSIHLTDNDSGSSRQNVFVVNKIES
jgi:putative phage-type endonuclease